MSSVSLLPDAEKAPHEMSVSIVYLDNNATTRCAPEVIEAMLPFFSEQYGNASSPHLLGRQASRAVALSRGYVAESLGCDDSCVYFTSGATEANNLVILGLTHLSSPRRKIVASAIEHKSVLGPCKKLADEGYEFAEIPVTSDGAVDIEAARDVIDEKTLLVSVQGANNEIGTIQPIRQLAEIAHEKGALVHCDAAQLLGKVPMRIDDLGADYFTFSTHKAYGPKGIGFLVIKMDGGSVSPSPVILGGGQENGLRPGTLNVPAIVGTGAACQLCRSCVEEDTSRILSLRKLLEESIAAIGCGIRVIASGSQRLPGTASILFPGLPADVLISRAPTVCMSASSACTSGTIAPSHVLLALGLSRDEARSTVRISLGRYNTAEEIRIAVEAISRVMARTA